MRRLSLLLLFIVEVIFAADIVLISRTVTGPEPCARVCFGDSQGAWKKNGEYIYIDTDLTDCHFASLPLVQASLVNQGDYSRYSGYIGIQQPTFFRYEMYAPGVSAAKANSDRYQINWSASGHTC